MFLDKAEVDSERIQHSDSLKVWCLVYFIHKVNVPI